VSDRPDSDASAAIHKIARRHALSEDFPPAVQSELEELLAAPGIDDPSLVDRTDLPFVSIDDATSRDLDQAVFVEREGEGYVVWYALADAAYYTRKGTALFEEALSRGASYYLPGFMVPMLPRPLSEDLVSLNEDVERRAMLFRIPVDAKGRATGTTIERARVRSRHKMSFEGVQDYYDDPARTPAPSPEVGASLDALRTVGHLRMTDARERDVVRYRRSELRVKVDGDGSLRFVARGALRLEVERVNEQISLLCNVEGARFLRDGDSEDDAVHPIYRVHPPPEVARVAELEERLAAMAKLQGLDEGSYTWRRGTETSLAVFLDALPTEGANARIAKAIHRQAVVINGRSCFATIPGGYFGVGADVYGRFSAPMREIVGVFLHAETWEKLGLAAPSEGDLELRERIVTAANEAKSLQKKIDQDANRLVLDQLFRSDLEDDDAPPRTATVMGMTRSKLHLTFDAPPVDVKAYLRDLSSAAGKELSPDPAGAALRDAHGQVFVRLGDEVRVRVTSRDEKRDRYRLALVL
jgi:ribonuclease R